MADKVTCPKCGKHGYPFLHSCPGVPQKPFEPTASTGEASERWEFGPDCIPGCCYPAYNCAVRRPAPPIPAPPSGCAKREVHRYYTPPRRCPCYLHYSQPMPPNMTGPCICECDHDSARERYLQTRIDEVRHPDGDS